MGELEDVVGKCDSACLYRSVCFPRGCPSCEPTWPGKFSRRYKFIKTRRVLINWLTDLMKTHTIGYENIYNQLCACIFTRSTFNGEAISYVLTSKQSFCVYFNKIVADFVECCSMFL